MPKNNQSRRHPRPDKPRVEQDQPGTPHAEHDHAPGEHAAWASEHAQEQSRQRAMAAREKATRTQLSVGQSGVMRLKKGNQPRGGR
ncbi:hypothetical protein [Catellatospora vulcania]|uniref:hypothetical protein n=1 Tax=Catellatospora vulcania TaxID=1460450 RepID=UPI0012D3FEDB|nr:hypothetical protein [Catellatospora vulcania]